MENLDKKYHKPAYPFNEDHEQYKEAEKQEHDEMVKKMGEYESLIGKNIIKYPT